MAPSDLPPLLQLPPEIRNCIYDLVVEDDLYRFAASFRRPTLLRACTQLRDEYSGVFFSDDHLTVTQFYHETGCWTVVSGKTAKMSIVEKCTFNHLVSYSSLASAQRYCERTCFNSQGARGILTIAIQSDSLHLTQGARWWQWSLEV